MIKLLCIIFALGLGTSLFAQKEYTMADIHLSFKCDEELDKDYEDGYYLYMGDNIGIDIEMVPFSEESDEFVKSAEYGVKEIASDFELSTATESGTLANVRNGAYGIYYDSLDDEEYRIIIITILDTKHKQAYEITIDCYDDDIDRGKRVMNSIKLSDY